MKLSTAFGALSMLIALPLMAEQLPYQNADLSAEQRVDDLIARMTLREKAGQMCQYVGIEHIKESEQSILTKDLKNSDAHAFYPDLRPEQIPALISKGDIGSFLHVMTATESNELQSYALKSRLGIPLIIGIDAIHGN
jgi:beta-glucosidase